MDKIEQQLKTLSDYGFTVSMRYYKPRHYKEWSVDITHDNEHSDAWSGNSLTGVLQSLINNVENRSIRKGINENTYN